MGVELVARSPVAAALFDAASGILGFDLLKLCREGPADQLNRTEFSQPALFVHAYAALKQLEQERPDLWSNVVGVAGLSLGEYTAVAAAGGVSFADGVRLVHLRGQAMQAAADAVPSSMSSVLGLEQAKLEEICRSVSSPDSFAVVANIVVPRKYCDFGPTQRRSKRLSWRVSMRGAMKAVRLHVAGGFSHSDHAARGEQAGRGARESGFPADASSGLLERGRRAAHRAEGIHRAAESPSRFASSMGIDAEELYRGWRGSVHRNRCGSRVGWNAEASRSKSGLRELQRLDRPKLYKSNLTNNQVARWF